MQHTHTDIDECSTSPCEYRCVNLPGAFRCTCPHGQSLQDDRQHCKGNYSGVSVSTHFDNIDLYI